MTPPYISGESKTPAANQSTGFSPTRVHNHSPSSTTNAPLSPLPFMLSCPLPLVPSPPPPANKPKWAVWCDVGGRTGAKKTNEQHRDGEGRRAGAQQTPIPERKQGPKGAAHRGRRGPSRLPRSHTCTKPHARSAERHKRKRAAIATPAAAVVMVTITTTPRWVAGARARMLKREKRTTVQDTNISQKGAPAVTPRRGRAYLPSQPARIQTPL